MMFNQTDLGLTELTLQQTAATQMAEKLIKDYHSIRTNQNI